MRRENHRKIRKVSTRKKKGLPAANLPFYGGLRGKDQKSAQIIEPKKGGKIERDSRQKTNQGMKVLQVFLGKEDDHAEKG